MEIKERVRINALKYVYEMILKNGQHNYVLPVAEKKAAEMRELGYDVVATGERTIELFVNHEQK
jgi:2-keto-3-deoxy-L-rhamnonate aldolase RhmA